MAVLVTGGCGYIGSVTVELLRKQGASVVVLDDLCRGHRSAVHPDVPVYCGTIGDVPLLNHVLSKHRVDCCIHFAALAYVGESVLDPARYFDNNVSQGVRFLRTLTSAGVNRVVFSSSCATYGEPQEDLILETHLQKPINPYGWSKFFMERILESYHQAYGLKFVALRYFNAAGATVLHGERHEPEPHLIPRVLETALGRHPHVMVFGSDYPTPDGTAIRDYVHVSDLGRAHILALRHLAAGGASQAINLGTGIGYSVLDVIETSRRVTGRKIEVKMAERRPGDPPRLVASAERAVCVLAWQPEYPQLDTIIQTAWDWHQAQPEGYSGHER